ncbi:hypothetical protein CcaverHIS002_0702160 [Cutaneotrichosporon cavernicola]|nr:hypothetical protein CcaverHIS002_0702160 [Cutaneotrichosporon cavernicola]
MFEYYHQPSTTPWLVLDSISDNSSSSDPLSSATVSPAPLSNDVGTPFPVFQEAPPRIRSKVSPPVPEWLVRKYEAGTEELETAVKVDSREVAQPVHSEADSLRDTPPRPLSQSDGKPIHTVSTLLEADTLRDTPPRPLSQSDGKPLHTVSTLLPLVHRSTSDPEPILLSQSDGEAQLAVQLPLSAGQPLGTPCRLLSELDGNQDARWEAAAAALTRRWEAAIFF